jgi:hypothetical protein
MRATDPLVALDHAAPRVGAPVVLRHGLHVGKNGGPVTPPRAVCAAALPEFRALPP